MSFRHASSEVARREQPQFDALVREALTQPGKISAAYSVFWEYSLCNTLLAMAQLPEPEPINTFPGWKALNRHVRKGEKAIALVIPVFKGAKAEVTERENERGPPAFYMMRRNWFGLSQTDGAEYIPPSLPDFDVDRAIQTLNIIREPFQSLSGNTMGYANTGKRIIAVSPLAFDALKTTAHEIAHVLLHADTVSIDSSDGFDLSAKEIEAELTAYMVKSALGSTENLEYSRGYIQSYLADTSLEKVRLPKVFAAADTILKAGRPAPG